MGRCDVLSLYWHTNPEIRLKSSCSRQHLVSEKSMHHTRVRFIRERWPNPSLMAIIRAASLTRNSCIHHLHALNIQPSSSYVGKRKAILKCTHRSMHSSIFMTT